MPQPLSYMLWFEAEIWTPGAWTSADDNTDVIVTFEDGSRWFATFVSYANIQTLTQKNRQTGECLAGAYFWSCDMLLIDEISRRRIDEVVRHLIEVGEFEMVFSHLPPAAPTADAAAE